MIRGRIVWIYYIFCFVFFIIIDYVALDLSGPKSPTVGFWSQRMVFKVSGYLVLLFSGIVLFVWSVLIPIYRGQKLRKAAHQVERGRKRKERTLQSGTEFFSPGN